MVDAELRQARRQQIGQQRGTPIERVARREPPPRRADETRGAHLLRAEPARRRRTSGHQVHDRDRVVARLLAEDVADERQVLDRVAVGVDDRMVEAGPDRGDLVAGKELHGAILSLAAMLGPWTATTPGSDSSATATSRW